MRRVAVIAAMTVGGVAAIASMAMGGVMAVLGPRPSAVVVGGPRATSVSTFVVVGHPLDFALEVVRGGPRFGELAFEAVAEAVEMFDLLSEVVAFFVEPIALLPESVTVFAQVVDVALEVGQRPSSPFRQRMLSKEFVHADLPIPQRVGVGR